MKKLGVLILGLLVSSVILSSLVLAADAGTSGVIGSVGDIVTSIYNSGIEPLAKWLIGGETAAGKDGAQNFFTLILMLVLLVSILWEVTAKVPFIGSNSWVQFIVSLSIAVISVRFLGESSNAAWFQTVLLPNQALGIALLCLIPFVIYFFFVMDIRARSPTLAKILWVFAAVLFAVLYFTRVDEIGKAVGAGKFNPANIYLLTALASFALLWFDGTIGKLMDKINVEKAKSATNSDRALLLRKRLREISDAFALEGEHYESIYNARIAHGKKSHDHDIKQTQDLILALKA